MPQAKPRHRVRGDEASYCDWEIAGKLLQDQTQRNVPVMPSPQRRARICEAIGRELALETFRRTNAKREARARLAIGLSPFRRKSICWDLC